MESLARKQLADLKPYIPGKSVEEVRQEFGLEQIIKLASNENALGLSRAAVDAIIRTATEANFYPDGGAMKVRQALAAKIGLAPDNFLVGNGSDEIIKLLALAFLNPDEECVVADYTFSEYEAVARLIGARVIKVPMQNLTNDLYAMFLAINEKTKFVFIANPNNPTGTIVTQDEVEHFMARIPDHVIVVFDEAYYEYVDDCSYADSVKYVKDNRNIVVLRTFSKAYGLAGLRIGYCIAKPAIIENLNKVKDPFNVNVLAQAAALASLNDQDFLRQSQAANRAEKDYLYTELTHYGFTYVPTQTNFLLIKVDVDDQKLFTELMKQGVIIRPGSAFGLDGYIRVTIGTRMQNKVFIDALINTIPKLR